MKKSPEQFESRESKEKEKGPFFFVYRENDLFKKYVPLIEAFLKEQGYQINLQSFPAGTSEEEIKDWYLMHQTELQSGSVLADNTTRESSEYELRPKINLDSLMNKATTEAIIGDATFAEQLRKQVCNNPENLEKKQEYLSTLGEMYKKILTSIPKEKRQKLEVVILRGLFKGNYEFPSLIAHEPYCPKRGNFEELSKETNEFASKMREWFKKAGISKINMFSTGAEIPQEIAKKLSDGQAYIIFDRHTSGGYRSFGGSNQEGIEDAKKFWGNNLMYADQIKEQSALQTPIETFYSDIQKKLGIEANPQKIEESIKKILQEELAEKNK